jgi:hypothetical protein
LDAQVTFFTNRIFGKTIFKGGLDCNPIHPIYKLMRDAMIFQLGKHAIDRFDLAAVRAYFALLEDSREPYRVFAKWISNKSYPGKSPLNPKLACLVIYLNDYRAASSLVRLNYLMKQVVLQLGRREAFLLRFIRLEVIELTRQTRSYKPLHDYFIHLEKL